MNKIFSIFLNGRKKLSLNWNRIWIKFWIKCSLIFKGGAKTREQFVLKDWNIVGFRIWISFEMYKMYYENIYLELGFSNKLTLSPPGSRWRRYQAHSISDCIRFFENFEITNIWWQIENIWCLATAESAPRERSVGSVERR